MENAKKKKIQKYRNGKCSEYKTKHKKQKNMAIGMRIIVHLAVIISLDNNENGCFFTCMPYFTIIANRKL